MSLAEQRRIAELQVRVGFLESEVEHWRDRALRAEQVGTVVPLRRIDPMEPISTADDDRNAIAKLRVPTYRPGRNLILDPIRDDEQ
jgi:hypothetical protein